MNGPTESDGTLNKCCTFMHRILKIRDIILLQSDVKSHSNNIMPVISLHMSVAATKDEREKMERQK